MTTRRPDILDVYARVSRLGDDRQRSTEGQVEDAIARVTERGATVGEVHIDSGRSAWNPRVRRPGWDRLMQRLESAEPEDSTGGVIVWDLARFSRRPIEGERLIAAAEHGLLILDSEGEYDLLSASGRKAFRDQMSAAAYESDRLSTRVKRGKKLAAMRGDAPVSMRPFGFEVDGRTVRETEAVIVRELVSRLLAGESQDTMIRSLDERGITTSTGKPWSRMALRHVLLRPRNAGLVQYNGTIVSRFTDDDVIIPEETYQRVAALYASRSRGRPNSPTYLCSGMIYCGRCGRALTGSVRRVLKPYPDGEPRREYHCHLRGANGGCGGITVDMRSLDLHIRSVVVGILGDPQHAAAVEAAARATQEARTELDRELADCEHLVEELDARLARREIDLKRYDRMVKPLERQAAELRVKLEGLAAGPEAPGVASAEQVAASREEWGRRWDAATVPVRRALMRQALRDRRVVVMPWERRGRPGPRTFNPARIAIVPPDDVQPGLARTTP